MCKKRARGKLLSVSSGISGTNDTGIYSYLYACFHRHAAARPICWRNYLQAAALANVFYKKGRRRQSVIGAFTHARWQMWQFSGMIHGGMLHALHGPHVQTVQNLQRPFHFTPKTLVFMEHEEAEARLSAIPYKWAN